MSIPRESSGDEPFYPPVPFFTPDPDAPLWPRWGEPGEPGPDPFGDKVWSTIPGLLIARIYRDALIKYEWKTRGLNCPVCNLMRGHIHSLLFWYQAIRPGFHPHCDCYLEKVPNDTKESNTYIFGLEQWIDKLNFSSIQKWFAHSLMPINFRAAKELSDAYMKTGSWSYAFDVAQGPLHSSWTFLDHPRLRMFEPKIVRDTKWNAIVGFDIVGIMQKPSKPAPYMPYETYR